MVFVVLGLGQLGIALAVRARRTANGARNPGLLAAVAASAVLQLAGVLVAPLRHLLGTAPLTPGQLAACLVVGAVPGALLAVGRHVGGPMNPRRDHRYDDR
jgi:Ca2+-transporting ATPase